MNANEQFIVKHYSEDERPILKGHGFDGLTIGNDRQEAQEFLDYLNTMLRQQQVKLDKYEQVLQSIANERIELSHDKIKWQCEDHIRWAKEALKMTSEE